MIYFISGTNSLNICHQRNWITYLENVNRKLKIYDAFYYESNLKLLIRLELKCSGKEIIRGYGGRQYFAGTKPFRYNHLEINITNNFSHYKRQLHDLYFHANHKHECTQIFVQKKLSDKVIFTQFLKAMQVFFIIRNFPLFFGNPL